MDDAAWEKLFAMAGSEAIAYAKDTVVRASLARRDWGETRHRRRRRVGLRRRSIDLWQGLAQMRGGACPAVLWASLAGARLPGPHRAWPQAACRPHVRPDKSGPTAALGSAGSSRSRPAADYAR